MHILDGGQSPIHEVHDDSLNSPKKGPQTGLYDAPRAISVPPTLVQQISNFSSEIHVNGDSNDVLECPLNTQVQDFNYSSPSDAEKSPQNSAHKVFDKMPQPISTTGQVFDEMPQPDSLPHTHSARPAHAPVMPVMPVPLVLDEMPQPNSTTRQDERPQPSTLPHDSPNVRNNPNVHNTPVVPAMAVSLVFDEMPQRNSPTVQVFDEMPQPNSKPHMHGARTTLSALSMPFMPTMPVPLVFDEMSKRNSPPNQMFDDDSVEDVRALALHRCHSSGELEIPKPLALRRSKRQAIKRFAISYSSDSEYYEEEEFDRLFGHEYEQDFEDDFTVN